MWFVLLGGMRIATELGKLLLCIHFACGLMEERQMECIVMDSALWNPIVTEIRPS